MHITPEFFYEAHMNYQRERLAAQVGKRARRRRRVPRRTGLRLPLPRPRPVALS